MATATTIPDAIEIAVAEHERVTCDDLPPLEEWVDPETFAKLTADRTEWDGPLEFTYIWYRVTISPDGGVTVTLPERR